jgi:hypothetical protein
MNTATAQGICVSLSAAFGEQKSEIDETAPAFLENMNCQIFDTLFMGEMPNILFHRH